MWWECIEKARSDWAALYKVWLTRQVADCCNTNKRLSYWEKNMTAQCNFCNEEHLTRRKLIEQTAGEISKWMMDSGAGVESADIVERYPCGHIKVTMKSCLGRGQEKFIKLAEDTDTLGWDSFVEDRLAKEWGSVIWRAMSATGHQNPPEVWDAKMANVLVQLTRRQWVLRNMEIHFKLPDG